MIDAETIALFEQMDWDDACATLRVAVQDWRDARTAVFDTPLDMKVTPEQFARLARAEHVLMDLARKK